MSLLDKIIQPEELPEKFPSLDAGIDMLLPYISSASDSLGGFDYIEKRWIEVRGDVHFHESILHVFKEDGKYLRILEGDIETGSWEYDINGFILKYKGNYELYELSFLNPSFFILRKHGDHSSKGNRPKYVFYTTESMNSRYEWPDILHFMFNSIYNQNSSNPLFLFGFLAIILIIIFFSIY